MWNDLKERFSQGNGPRVFELQKAIASLRQDQLSVSLYYTKMKSLWDELMNYKPLPSCPAESCIVLKSILDYQHREHVIYFLMGLNESFAQIRSQILLYDPLPSINQVFSLVLREEKQLAISSIAPPILESNAASIIKASTTSGKPYNSGPRQQCYKRPFCTHCNMHGHVVEKCYKIHGCPPGFKSKGKPSTMNQVFVTTTDSAPHFPFSQEKCQQLSALLNTKGTTTNDSQTTMASSSLMPSFSDARRQGYLIKPAVEAWQESAKTTQDTKTRLSDEAKQINTFSQYCNGYRLGKEAKEKKDNIGGLLKEGILYSTNTLAVFDPPPPSGIESLPAPADLQDFSSRDSIKEKIIMALKDEKINVVGVYGMGGVGKTTLMKELAKQVKNDHVFDDVVMVTLPRNQQDVETKIQDDIAEDLGMKKFEVVSQTQRIRRLSTALREKKHLVILDDVWKKLDLSKVGIPLGSLLGCKVVLTTTNKDICSDAQEKIEVKILSKEESWALFRQKVGDIVHQDSQDLAMDIVKGCRGLPLAIVKLASALRDKDHKMWKDAAQQLKKSNFFQHDYSIFSSIKLSYDNLESDEIKRCFLFCCLFPEGYNLSEDMLMRYVIGEELLSHVDSLKEARGRFHTVVHKLIMASCLEEGDGDGSLRMHSIVRDAALKIASEENNGFIVKADSELQRWPDKVNLTTCKRMSLGRNKISELPDNLECTQLLTLSLSENLLKVLPDNFFKTMTSLVILDLGYNQISSLPLSISCLMNLRTVCLEKNPLIDVSGVGKLKKLEILILSGTGIKNLPEAIRELTNLKLLDMSETYDLETIPQNLLSGFSCLEELYMLDSNFREWEIAGMGDGKKASLEELASLNVLDTLHIGVDDVNCFSEKILKCLLKLTAFHIVVGKTRWRSKFSKVMNLTTAPDPLPNSIKELLKETEDLVLSHCEGLKNVGELDAGGFRKLKSLSIEKCDDMEYMMIKVKEDSKIAFSSLERLCFKKMNGLKAIYHGSIPNGFLKKLKFLEVDQCHKIINVLSVDLLARLQNLESLKVYRCDELEKVFDQSMEVDQKGRAMMPSLRIMRLWNLPKLATIWKEVVPLASFQELTTMEVYHCGRLRYLFSQTMVQRLQKLEVLKVWSCSGMVKIIESEADKTVLPRLMILILDELPILSSFSQQPLLLDLPSLDVLGVAKCPNLKKLPFGPQSAPKLRVIYGDNFKWFDDLKWEDNIVKSRLQPLFKLATK